jgi:hypothetical protein
MSVRAAGRRGVVLRVLEWLCGGWLCMGVGLVVRGCKWCGVNVVKARGVKKERRPEAEG